MSILRTKDAPPVQIEFIVNIFFRLPWPETTNETSNNKQRKPKSSHQQSEIQTSHLAIWNAMPASQTEKYKFPTFPYSSLMLLQTEKYKVPILPCKCENLLLYGPQLASFVESISPSPPFPKSPPFSPPISPPSSPRQTCRNRSHPAILKAFKSIQNTDRYKHVCSRHS